MPRNSLGLLLLALAACDSASVGNRTQRSGDVAVIGIDEGENASESPEGVGAPTAWRVVDGAAYYGAANQPPVFALKCDARAQQIVFERAGGGATLSLSAGGSGVSLGTRAVDDGRVQARTGLGDAVLDAMASPRTQIQVGGGAEILTVPGGVAIRRVLDFCRAPPASEPAATNNSEPNPLVIPETIDEPAPDPLQPPR
jgi:hypothetical protein